MKGERQVEIRSAKLSSNTFNINDEIMAKINNYSRKVLKADEVYAFPVILCDNDVDRDYERFSVKSLETLAQMFIGKTGIFDHNPKGENQTARIFDTEVKTDKNKKTVTGEDYTYLLAKAYMIKTSKTQDLIAEIEAGIKKEVSISCKADSEICSVCGADKRIRPCAHIKGRTYGNKVCHTVLEHPSDAYEWSFVAIPAQPNAGVSKEFSNSFDYEYLNPKKKIILKSKEDLKKELAQKDDMISMLYQSIIQDIISMKYLCEPNTKKEILEQELTGLDCEKLLKLKQSLGKQAQNKSLFAPQLWEKKDNKHLVNQKKSTENNEFRL